MGLKKVSNRNDKQYANLKGGLMNILVINEMVNSSSFKSKICKPSLIQELATLFENSEKVKNNKALDEFRSCLF